MDSFDKKLDALEKKIDSRLNVVEEKCIFLEKKTVKLDKQHKCVSKEVSQLKSTVNVLEQQKLQNNILIKGVVECENADNDLLSDMVDSIFSHIEQEFRSDSVLNVRRIGPRKENLPRPILVEMVNYTVKMPVMKNLKDKELNCEKFENKGIPWGKKEHKIYIRDHLTPTNNTIFYHARQLRKKNKVKFAWTKLGQIYIKVKDDSYAIHVTSIEQLEQIANQLEAPSDAETENEPTETETENDTDVVPDERQPSRKRNNKHLSPMYTRSKKNVTNKYTTR